MTDMKENKSMRDWLLKVLGRTVPKDWSTENQYGVSLIQGEATNAEAISIVLVTRALNGELDAIKEVFDRVDRKSPIFVKSRSFNGTYDKSSNDFRA